MLLSIFGKPVKRTCVVHTVGVCLTAVICITNVSLLLNNVGTYQLFRIAKILAVFPCSYRQLNHRHFVSALLVSVGLAAAVAHDLSATAFGITVAALGSVGSAWVGVLQKRVQEELKVDYLSALLAFAPSQTISALLVARLLDGPWVVSEMPPGTAVALLAASVVLATCLNASHQAVLSRVSPLAYQLGTQLPSLIILAIGLVPETSPVRITGIVSVVIGGASYAFADYGKWAWWGVVCSSALSLLLVFLLI